MEYFKSGAFYMHNQAADCFIEVRDIVTNIGGAQKFYARYWNLSFDGRPFLLEYPEYLFHVDVKEARDWVELDVEAMTVPRALGSGVPRIWAGEQGGA